MPVSKDSLLRYQVLNTCLRSRNKKYWSMQDLLQALCDHDIVVTSRTVEKDFAVMRFDDRLGYHAPIKWCPVNRGYYYTDPEYSIDVLGLSQEQLLALACVRDFMQSFSAIGLLGQVPATLERVIRRSHSALLQQWPRVPTLHCQTPATTNAVAPYVSMLCTATYSQTVVHLHVKEEGKGEEDYDLHPYTVSTDYEHWYVIGLRDDTHIHIFVQLEYISSLSLSTRAYIPFHNPFEEVKIPFVPREG